MADGQEETPKRPVTLWLNAKGRELIIGEATGLLVRCWACPCCRPRVIGSFITNASDESRKVWWLTEYLGPRVGLPGARWRLRDVGEAHHGNETQYCSGSQYGSGIIDAEGRLVNLPEKFESGFRYDGYMELQQGCPRDDGTVDWPCPGE